MNAERNSFTTYSDHVKATHKKEGRDNCLTEIPKNVVIIEAAMFDKYNEWYTRSFKIKGYNKCGDTDIRSCHTKKLILI